MAWSLDPRLCTPRNDDIVAYLRRASPSAHDDVGSALVRSADGLSDVRWYCPDAGAYAYVVLYAGDGTIFGLAQGMSGLAYRLPPDAVADALAEGGEARPELGRGWTLVPPWGPRARHWCRIAHDYAARAAGR